MEKNRIEKLKTDVMNATVNSIKSNIQDRMNKRIEVMNTLSGQPLDNLPESVKLEREKECGRLRAVIQEQSDLISLINALFPNG